MQFLDNVSVELYTHFREHYLNETVDFPDRDGGRMATMRKT